MKVKRKCTMCGDEFIIHNTDGETNCIICNENQIEQKKTVREIKDMKKLMDMVKNLFGNSSRSDIIRKKEQKECREMDKAKAKAKRDTPEYKAKQKIRNERYKIRKEKLKNEH